MVTVFNVWMDKEVVIILITVNMFSKLCLQNSQELNQYWLCFYLNMLKWRCLISL